MRRIIKKQVILKLKKKIGNKHQQLKLNNNSIRILENFKCDKKVKVYDKCNVTGYIEDLLESYALLSYPEREKIVLMKE